MNGVSTRKVERLASQLGIESMSRSTVSRLCKTLDEQVRLFRERPLAGRYPYLWLDAKVERVREAGGVRSKALVVAYAVHESGCREVIGIDVGEAESEAFWREFLRGLLARGLEGVRLAVSDAHEGLKRAIAQVLGCPWQRCTVHFLRDMQGHVHRSQQQMVAAAVRQVFAAEDGAEARTRLASVVAGLEGAAPKVALLLEAAEEELLAFMSFPREHWPKLRSTNPWGTKTRSRRSFVLMDQPAKQIAAPDARRSFDPCDRRSTFGSQKLQPSMRSFLVVVLHVGPQGAVEMTGSEDQQPVQAVGANGLHPAFGEGVGVRGSDRCADHPHTFASEDIIKGAGELGVAVADQELDARALVREADRKVARLLGDEDRVRTARRDADAHAPAADLDEEEHVERLQECRLHGEEVAGDDA